MIRRIARRAAELDHQLHQRFGRPYHVMLSIGLIIGIVDQVRGLLGKFLSGHLGIGHMLVLALDAALLINQLGSLSQRFEKSDPRRDRSRTQKI